MSVVINEVRHSAYFDSIALMRISRQVQALTGVEEAGLVIGTPANKQILRAAGILAGNGEQAQAGDLIIALRAAHAAAADAALTDAIRLLEHPDLTGTSVADGSPRSLRSALQLLPGANLALISVPGHFAADEARKALRLGLHVMIFSDNVALEDEVALKREASAVGRFVMGPDCGTAIVGGMPLAFANVVPRGNIGIIGASGTGIQEISSLIARCGGGISHAVGTGGRDLHAEVGALTTLLAIDAFDADPQTHHVVLVSKPPAAAVARGVLERVARSAKPFTICFLGADTLQLPKNARSASTLKQAAELALGTSVPAAPLEKLHVPSGRGRLVRGLFAGGTLCAEAQVVFRQAGLGVASNVPAPGAAVIAETSGGGHIMLDLGADEFTRGRPHPMIEPSVRDQHLAEALADPAIGVLLLDVVLGHGGHPDPAGHLASVLASGKAGRERPLIIASVTGTEQDPQPRSAQVRKLTDAGVIVAPTNADAAELAIAAALAP